MHHAALSGVTCVLVVAYEVWIGVAADKRQTTLLFKVRDLLALARGDKCLHCEAVVESGVHRT